MMKFLMRVLIPALRSLLQMSQDSPSALRQLLGRLLRWHQRQMESDPAYPAILAIVCAGIIRITVQNKAVAALLAAMIARSLGLTLPGMEGGRWDNPDQYE